jgi:hypothetical protein
MILSGLRCAALVGVLALGATNCLAQDRYDSGQWKGFTKYTAFQIVVLDTPFTQRQVEGSVFRSASTQALSNVLVEIRDSEGRIRATNTDSKGRFKFGKLPDGQYDFKTTLNGFSSVVGKFIVQRGVKKSDEVRIEMPLGV